MTITLVGKDVAETGYEFVYLGEAEECSGCRLRTVCNSLDRGSRYKVTEVRKQEHDCALLEGGIVAVRVEKTAAPAVLPKRGLMDGVTVTFTEPRCGMPGCPNWNLCNPVGRRTGDKLSVVRVDAAAECPAGERVARVEVLRRGRRGFIRTSRR